MWFNLLLTPPVKIVVFTFHDFCSNIRAINIHLHNDDHQFRLERVEKKNNKKIVQGIGLDQVLGVGMHCRVELVRKSSSSLKYCHLLKWNPKYNFIIAIGSYWKSWIGVAGEIILNIFGANKTAKILKIFWDVSKCFELFVKVLL